MKLNYKELSRQIFGSVLEDLYNNFGEYADVYTGGKYGKLPLECKEELAKQNTKFFKRIGKSLEMKFAELNEDTND